MINDNPHAKGRSSAGLACPLSRSPAGPRWAGRLEPAVFAWCAVLADALFLMAATAGLVP